MLKTLDLFSGIGGFAVGLEATNFFKTTCFVEQEPYCQAVLRHHWPEVPILGDIKNVKRSDLPDPDPDVILGGFPCQPFSQAGHQKAQSDSRHLWPEMFRLIKECRPTWVIGENVIGIVKLGLDEVLTDLENEGYATRTFNIPACAVGAPHLRQRVWIVAHSDSKGEPDGSIDAQAQGELGNMGYSKHDGSSTSPTSRGMLDQSKEPKGSKEVRKSKGAGSPSRNVADTVSTGTGVEEYRSGGQGRKSSSPSQPKVLQQGDRAFSSKGSSASSKNVADTQSERHGRGSSKKRGNEQRIILPKEQGGSKMGSEAERCGEPYRPEQWWESEPPVGRLAHGVSHRVSQIRALGNSIIPQIAKEIGNAIKQASEGTL
jgi:DNA (cytosine-5)-methyltransferase 1